MKIYCYVCGSPTDYSLEKPKFCQKCGSGYNSASEKKSLSKPKAAEEETQKIPHINKLDVEITNATAKGITFGSLMESSSPDTKIDKFNSQSPKRVNKKKFWNDFKKEAGRLRDS